MHVDLEISVYSPDVRPGYLTATPEMNLVVDLGWKATCLFVHHKKIQGVKSRWRDLIAWLTLIHTTR